MLERNYGGKTVKKEETGLRFDDVGGIDKVKRDLVLEWIIIYCRSLEFV